MVEKLQWTEIVGKESGLFIASVGGGKEDHVSRIETIKIAEKIKPKKCIITIFCWWKGKDDPASGRETYHNDNSIRTDEGVRRSVTAN